MSLPLTVCQSSTDPPQQQEARASGFLRCGNKRPYGACGHKVLVWSGGTVRFNGNDVRMGMASGDISLQCPVCPKFHKFTQDYLERLTKG